MRKLDNRVLKGYNGYDLELPRRTPAGDLVRNGGPDLEMEAATVQRILKSLVYSIHPQLLTFTDTVHGARLYSQVSSIEGDTLYIEDAEWDWLQKKLSDDKIAPGIFGMNAWTVKAQLEAIAETGKASREV